MLKLTNMIKINFRSSRLYDGVHMDCCGKLTLNLYHWRTTV